MTKGISFRISYNTSQSELSDVTIHHNAPGHNNNEPNPRIESVAHQIMQQYRQLPEEALAALEDLFKNDIRFNNTDRNQFSFIDGIRIEGALKYEIAKVRSQSKTILKGQNELDKKAVSEIKKNIAPLLVEFVNRQTVQSEFKVGGKTYTLSETHISSPSAEVQKGAITTEAANKRCISIKDENGSERVVGTFSSRTDDIIKIKQKSNEDIQARLNTDSKEGLVIATDSSPDKKIYNYTRLDVTFMDASPIKSKWTRATSQRKPPEDERAFLQAKRDAINDCWNDKCPYVVHILKNGTKVREYYIEHKLDNGTIVREFKPVVLNHVFSGEATNLIFSRGQVKKARESNIDANIKLFSPIINKLGLPNIQHAINVFEDSKKSSSDLAELTSMIRKTLVDLSNPLSIDSNESCAVLKDFYFCLTGEFIDDSRTYKYDSASESALQYMMTIKYAKACNNALSVECKSGNDRTATAVAITCAQEEFEKIHGYPFLLRPKKNNADESYEKEFKEFKDLFNKYMIDFGKPTVLASRGQKNGKPVLKTASSPIFNIFADRVKLEPHFDIK